MKPGLNEAGLTAADEVIIVFAREPEYGKVKTRLAKDSNESVALAIYQRLLDRTLRLSRRVARSRSRSARNCQLLIAAAGAPPAGFLASYASRNKALLWHQPEGDLGHRMAAAFAAGFGLGAGKVILLGCDAPSLRHADLHSAFDKLSGHEVSIAPTRDGGYCLIGLHEAMPCLFANMRWGQADVLANTLSRAEGRRVALLREQQDIDHLTDWQAWCGLRREAGRAEAELV